MSISYLDEKRSRAAKEKIHLELVDYFARLNSEQRSWCFMRAIMSCAQSQRFTQVQAERLITYLSCHYGIREANIDTALTFNAFPHTGGKKSPEVIRLKRDCVADDAFEQQMRELEGLCLEKCLEYWQALELTVLILNHYPACIKKFRRSSWV